MSDPHELLAFARIAIELHEHEQARKYLLEAVQIEPDNQQAWLQLAKLTDEREEALTCLDKVLSINPENVEARKMIDRLRRQTDPDELRAMLQIAVEIGDKQAARSYCLKILDTEPNDEQTWITLGRSCDDWDEALAHSRQALAINPESEQARAEIKHILEQKENHCWAFAKAALQSGDKEQACKYLREVLEINAKSEKAWLKLGQLASDPQEALGYFEHVLTINPANEQAHIAIRRTREQQEAERLRAQQALEQVRAEEELERLGHFVFRVSEESAEPSRKVVGKWSIPSVTRIGQIGVVLVVAILIIWLTSSHLKSVPTPATESTVPPRTVVAIPTPTMTYREAIQRAQQAAVALGVIDWEGCRYAGSGTVVDPKGLIVTNAHVVTEGDSYCIMYAEELEGETHWHHNARVVKRDTLMDLALLRIESHSDGSPVSNLPLVAVPMGDSDNVHIGDSIYVCGYPGVGGHNVTVTQGLVSGFEESRTLIKTDTEISPGSSGGVAITENGLLIGIPTSARIAPWGSGKIGYLIAVNEVRGFLGIVEGSEKNWVTSAPKPTATTKPVYAAPLVLATMTGQGEMVTDNFWLPACKIAVVSWSLGFGSLFEYPTFYLYEGKQHSLLFKSARSVGWTFQSFWGGEYYLSIKETDDPWSVKIECRNGLALMRTALDLHATGDTITDPYELPACSKSVFVWSVEPESDDSLFNTFDLALCDENAECVSIVDVDVWEVDSPTTTKGETLQPLHGGVYLFVSTNASGQSWSVRWECRD